MSEKNKAFWNKTDAQKRVAVAKDVIKQIELRFYVPKTGNYFRVSKLDGELKAKPKLDDVLKDLQSSGGKCEVCGIGGCFASLVRVGNNMTTSASRINTWGSEITELDSIQDDEMRPLLRTVFPPRQLTLIECCFETEVCHEDGADDGDATRGELAEASRFGERYKTDKGRMIAIMKNIIANKGTFIP